MASDRARISHDPTRDYRALVLQQGRVTLEADGNEASSLSEDALRADVIDIVGPYGTPDDGYEVSAAGTGLLIGKGSYYLGGWRVDLAKDMRFGAGADELDLAAPRPASGNHAIALLLTEQEVSAVEDHALLEVALGGPDTCQRTRLMQRAVALAVRGDDCSSAEQDLDAALLSQGAVHDHQSGMLKPTARLQVQVIHPPVPPDPCDPPASGGYLGADNQLIRLSVVDFDPGTGKGRLVWGFDNASTLYRASTSDGQVLTLEGDPIDSDHAPFMGQAVEVLRTRKLFDHGDVVAADSGRVTTLAQPYNSDLRTVKLAATLPAGTRGDAQHPLFLRLWREEIAFTNGAQVDLGNTGFAVTLSLSAAPGPVVARPYWTFAVRPSTPVIIYPRRYLDAPQPPEGPRQWLAPLAVAAFGGRTPLVLDDCRDTFLPLTKIKAGCCGVILDARMKGRDVIQRALDRLRGTRGTVTLRPGHYRLRKPIRLDSSHIGLTLEGCGEGVFLEAADEKDKDFGHGLIHLDDANEVTLRSLQLQMPVGILKGEGLRPFALIGAPARAGTGSIGITASGCAQLTITECQFRFRLLAGQPIYAVGVMGQGECWGLTMTRNRFLHDVDREQEEDGPRIMIGYQLVPAIRMTPSMTLKQLSEGRLEALLDDAVIADNRFAGLTCAIWVSARLGCLRVERNRAQGCSGGITLAESALATAYRTIGHVSKDQRFRQLAPTRLLAASMTFAANVPLRARKQPVLDAARLRAVSRQADARARAFINALDPAEAATPGRGTAGAVPSPAELEERQLVEGFQRIAAAIEVRHGDWKPVLHIHANDLDVLGSLDRKPSAPGATGTGVAKGPSSAALLVALDPRKDVSGDVLITANRLAAKVGPAAQILWPARLVFGSNMVIGSRARDSIALDILASAEGAMLEVMGNVIDGAFRIQPSQRPLPPSQSWAFVNRVP